MEKSEIEKGMCVFVKSMRVGAEVVDCTRQDGRIEVKIARMNVTSKGVETDIRNEVVDADDLLLIKKKRGVVII